MSVAFVREESAETAAEVMLPDRPVSSHPNLVTSSGLEALRSALKEARAAYEAAQTIEDLNERRQVGAPAVGEDEADPKRGSISYVSPVARALMGKTVKDEARIGDQQIEILAIEP
jgi:transcription elongation GreA/GreB family factor